MTSERYIRNIGTISPEEHDKLRNSWVCVVGCGGLGGYVIEGLARLGVGHITAVDGDVFQQSNLNRQLLATERSLGRYKALVAQERVRIVNPEISLHPLCYFLSEENAADIIAEEYHVAVDAMDNIAGRRVLEKACEGKAIPLIHGAIAGWCGQVSVIMPGSETFAQLYPKGPDRGIETITGTPCFTPAVVGAIQAAETVKLLLERPGVLKNKLLTIDLLSHEYEIIDI